MARHLQELPDPTPSDVLAIHFHAAGLSDEAKDHSRTAAHHAEDSGAVPEALRFLEIAREHASDPDEVAELIARMGHLHYLHQNLEEAAPLLEVAAQRLRRQGQHARALASELERVDALGQSGLLPLKECLEELGRIRVEAEALEEWGTYMKTLDAEARQRDRDGDLEGIRVLLRDGEAHAHRGDAEARSRAQALLALHTYLGDPQLGLRAARAAIVAAEETGDNDLYLHALNRLILALVHLGLLNTSEGKKVLHQAEERVARCGDLLLKSAIHMNFGVWYLETRDLDRAHIALDAAAAILRGTKAARPQALIHLNLGELHFVSFDIPRARTAFLAAESHLSSASRDHYRWFITAGLGLCALYEGDLVEARSREAELSEFTGPWTFDPALIVAFSARMKARRGDHSGALELLERVRREIRARFVTGWLRLVLEECWIAKERDPARAIELASEALILSRSLRISSFEKYFLPFVEPKNI